MSLKQSCFKAVLKNDFKRMWWVGALSTIFMFMTFTSSYLQSYKYTYNRTLEPSVSEFATLVILGVPVAFILGQMVFNYLNGGASVSFLHSLPVKRMSLMAAHVTFAVITILAPALINYTICVAGIDNAAISYAFLKAFGIYSVITLLIFSLSMLVALLTGNSVAGGIFTLVLIGLPAFLYSFVQSICTHYLFGYFDYTYDYYEEQWLNKYIYLDMDDLMTPKVLIYIGLILVCTVLSVVIYKSRHLENHGEIIAFTCLNGLFKVIFGMCFGIVGYFWSDSMWGFESIVTLFVFVPAGVIVANFLSNKCFSFKKLSKPLIVTICIVAVLFSVFQFDIFGYETKIPSLSEVESITYVDGYDRYSYAESADGKYWQSIEMPKPVITDKETIKELHDFHKSLIQKRNDYRVGEYYWDLTFEYNLVDGTSFLRTYDHSYEEYREYERIVFDTDVVKHYLYPILDETADYNFYQAKIVDTRANLYQGEITSKSLMNSLVEALKADKSKVTFEEYEKLNKAELLRIEIYHSRAIEYKGITYYDRDSDYYYIDESHVNTIAVLESAGFLDGVKRPIESK